MAAPVFDKVDAELNFPKEEQKVLEFWKRERIFERSLDHRKNCDPFVFYEGPPTANGLPHNGHVLTRVIKDLFPRYKTMQGYHVPRKAGWDTHGLPVEVEVEKELRIHGKAAIEQYGVEPFVKRCIESVFRYTREWEKLTEQVGFWVDLRDAYVTYHQSYVESVWWALSELFNKGLLYQGHKVVWWWAQGGTALSSGEVGLGYKTVDDPSVFVAFPLKDEPDTSLLVWTTTPWTLPSNMYAAVHPEFEYVVVTASLKEGDRKFIVAKGLVQTLAKKLNCSLALGREMRGAELAGKEYTPPFDAYASRQKNVETKDRGSIPAYWRVIAADFVLLDASGIVHVAPAFGEDDFNAHKKELARLVQASDVELLCAVGPDGNFTSDLPKYQGRWVKDCDKEIQAELKERGRLVHAEVFRHDYPFCWRSDNDPLIQFARPAWYIRTTALIEKAIENNRTIQWLPDHIKEGRFGDFLANNVDWALSRERYWGTPLNIWICDRDESHRRAPASVAEIEKLGGSFAHFNEAKKSDPSLSDHLRVHKPWIDAVTFACPDCGGTMKRIPEVIDCWFDSGCMPFAQWGFPHKGQNEFLQSFPADFISEAIDQTRGWFYSLLMISTLVFDEATQKRLGIAPVRTSPHPFKTCIVLGHVSDKEGKKESKSKGNYTPPEVILESVRMDFAVVSADQATAIKGVKGAVAPGESDAFIAAEDLDGLDLQDGAKVVLSNGERRRECTLRALKGLPRRIVVLHPAARDALSVVATKATDVKPVEVPWLPAKERVVVADPNSPAPGADAFRWFFYASSPPWSATRHSLSNVRALQKEFAVKLRNVYSFFVIYANIDGFDPFAVNEAAKEYAKKPELDRWILSELAITTELVTSDLDGYDVYTATQRLISFVDALSNWYVRRSRDRFWRSGWDDDKSSAYATLYECLGSLAKISAPFTPFAAEAMYQNLAVRPAVKHQKIGTGKGQTPESVHLADFPKADSGRIDRALSAKIKAVRDLVSLGLQVRTHHKLKVRQPLRAAHLILADVTLREKLRGCDDMIKEELNVLGIEFVPPDEARRFVEYKLKPNFRTLGQRGLGKEAQHLKKVMAEMTPQQAFDVHAALIAAGVAHVGGVELTHQDVEIAFETKEGFAAAGDRVGVVALETRLDDELRELGFLRELQNRVQTVRKDMGLEYTDRIDLSIAGGERVQTVIKKYGSELAREVLAKSVRSESSALSGAREFDVDGEKITLSITR